MKANIKDIKKSTAITPIIISGSERLIVWQKAQKAWRKRTNVDAELKKLRKSWDRKLPKLS